MFSKSTITQRKPFQLTVQQIEQDIKSICNNEEHRSKLYFCLDEKPPQEDRFSKVEDFLKGTDELENVVQKLETASNNLYQTTIDLEQKTGKIKQKAENFRKH